MRTIASIAAVLLLLAPFRPALAASAEESYVEARAAYFELKADAKKRAYRHHWLRVIAALDKSVARLGKSAKRCDALYNAGRAYADLSAISYIQEDRDAAAQRFRSLATRCPSSTLSDDGLVEAATLSRDPAAARRDLEQVLARHPKGDKAAEARRMLAELPKAEPRKAVAKAEPEPRRATKTDAKPEPREELAAAKPAAASTDKDLSGQPGAALPSAAAILASLDAKGADANRAEDVALEEDLRKDAARAAEPPKPDRAAAPVAAPPQLDRERLAALQRATGGEIPLSLAAGLKVKRVVIDPGHGGKDTGAIGRRGTREKDLTLAISRKVAKQLRAMGLEVLLTRDKDEFLELEERTRFANEKHADLFISIHVNAAANRKARGIETYTLNLNSDRYAMRLAARENASSSRSIGDLQFILADLATKANTDDSVRLAKLVQGEMVSDLKRKYGAQIRDLGVKQALFFVLVGAKMPAILVETSFVSNREEENRLRTDTFQELTAKSIADGVRRFIDEREAIARGSAGEDRVRGSGVF